MKIVIPKVIVSVSMADYASELDGKFLQVWVNPPMKKLQEYSALVTSLQETEVESARQTLFPDESIPKSEERSALEKTYDVINRFLKFKKEHRPEGTNQQLLDWYADIWSQGPESTRWTVDELRTLETNDPAFLSWMINHTWQACKEHREGKKIGAA